MVFHVGIMHHESPFMLDTISQLVNRLHIYINLLHLFLHFVGFLSV